jgi:glucarate dehydratase
MAAMIHAAAITPNLITACDTHYMWLQEDIIVGDMFRFEEGMLRVPTAPGLGVRLDRDKLARFHERYLKSQERMRDDTAAMRRRDPNYLPLRPRW